jgi:hypothetical protein
VYVIPLGGVLMIPLGVNDPGVVGYVGDLNPQIRQL